LFARLVYAELSVYPGTRERAEKVLTALKTELGQVEGLSSYTLFNNWAQGQVGAFVVWTTKEAEEKAWQGIRGRLDDARDVMWKGRPLFGLFDVFDQGTGAPAAAAPARRGRKPGTTAAKMPAAKKPATKMPAAKKPAAKKPAGKKPATRRTAAGGTRRVVRRSPRSA